MAKQKPFVTDEQWIRLEPLLLKPKPSPKGGRKPRDNREVFDGIIWVLRSGARWNDLPGRYPSASLLAKITAVGRARPLAENMA